MTKWAKKQPKDGETILHCGHLEAKRFEWFQFPDWLGFKRPDGTEGRARWVAQCPECFIYMTTHEGEPVVNGDDVWIGDAPAIKDVRG